MLWIKLWFTKTPPFNISTTATKMDFPAYDITCSICQSITMQSERYMEKRVSVKWRENCWFKAWITNLRTLWMDKWARWKLTQDWQKVVSNRSFYLIMPNLVTQLNKNLHSPKLHLQCDHIKTDTRKCYVWICLGTTSMQVNHSKLIIDLKNGNLAELAFKKNLTNPPLKPTKTEPSFMQKDSCSPLGQRVMSANLLFVLAPRMESSYTHSR